MNYLLKGSFIKLGKIVFKALTILSPTEDTATKLQVSTKRHFGDESYAESTQNISKSCVLAQLSTHSSSEC